MILSKAPFLGKQTQVGDMPCYPRRQPARFKAKCDQALKDYVLGDEKTFAYCDPTSPESCLQLAEVLNRYVTAEGPYDGIIGFSFGACIAISWMLYLRQEGGGKAKLPFKVGIFFSNALPLSDLNALRQGQIKHLIKPPECLDLPSAHIWGAKDAGHENARFACETCSASTRAVYIHDKGHGIPTSVDDTVSMVKTINRAIMSV